MGARDRMKALWATFTPERVTFCCGVFQVTVCIILAAVSASLHVDWGSIDSAWFYLLQVPVTIAMLTFSQKLVPDRRLAKLMLGYAIFTMILGLVCAFFFMIFSNDYEITKRKCALLDDPVTAPAANMTEDTCREAKDENIAHIARSVVFLVAQVACVHPAVSVAIGLWNDGKIGVAPTNTNTNTTGQQQQQQQPRADGSEAGSQST